MGSPPRQTSTAPLAPADRRELEALVDEARDSFASTDQADLLERMQLQNLVAHLRGQLRGAA